MFVTLPEKKMYSQRCRYLVVMTLRVTDVLSLSQLLILKVERQRTAVHFEFSGSSEEVRICDSLTFHKTLKPRLQRCSSGSPPLQNVYVGNTLKITCLISQH